MRAVPHQYGRDKVTNVPGRNWTLTGHVVSDTVPTIFMLTNDYR